MVNMHIHEDDDDIHRHRNNKACCSCLFFRSCIFKIHLIATTV